MAQPLSNKTIFHINAIGKNISSIRLVRKSAQNMKKTRKKNKEAMIFFLMFVTFAEAKIM